jgi:hypothetical protein
MDRFFMLKVRKIPILNQELNALILEYSRTLKDIEYYQTVSMYFIANCLNSKGISFLLSSQRDKYDCRTPNKEAT